ncbi:MAG: hypothetical protein KF838_04965 [Phycisphaeraceae bacterium]|nr:MAG: hypothetical protein KF838_04965 [Phycisphaeraceae bacterium]
MAVQYALIGVGVAARELGRRALKHVEELAKGDRPRGLAKQTGAEGIELFVGVDLGLDLGRLDVIDERVEGNLEVIGEACERQVRVDDVEDEEVSPALARRDVIACGVCFGGAGRCIITLALRGVLVSAGRDVGWGDHAPNVRERSWDASAGGVCH